MSTPRIGRSQSRLTIDTTRVRQTPRIPSTFKQVLAGGAQVLISGAAAATKVIGLPSMSAAISSARLSRNLDPSAPALGGSGTSGSTSTDPMKSLLDQHQSDELKLLKLQSEIQAHNRQITMVSNVMKARHDTAKAAISNMRS
ncbi:MAG: hypothetical protein KC503_03785 [Myxococcales bacterium]|nr:hypothetical protein [Myxococcales bacterium]